jgi:hypothetical protein
MGGWEVRRGGGQANHCCVQVGAARQTKANMSTSYGCLLCLSNELPIVVLKYDPAFFANNAGKNVIGGSWRSVHRHTVCDNGHSDMKSTQVPAHLQGKGHGKVQ